MDNQLQIKSIFSDPQEGQKTLISSSLVSNFNRFIKKRLYLQVDTQKSCELSNRQQNQTQGFRNSLKTISKLKNVGESHNQRDELDRLTSQRPTLRQTTIDQDEEMETITGSNSTSQQSQQQQQPLLRQTNIGQTDLDQESIMDSFLQNIDPQANVQQPESTTTTDIQQLSQQIDNLVIGSNVENFLRPDLVGQDEHTWLYQQDRHTQLYLQQQQQLQTDWNDAQQLMEQQQNQDMQQILSQQLDTQYRQQVSLEAQQLLQEYLDQITHTSSSGIPTSFAVQSGSDSSETLLQQPQLLQTFMQQPVAEAGASGVQQQQRIQQPQQQTTQLRPSNVKYEKPDTFNGKHSETENFIFSIQAYVHATQMSDRDAAEFLTLYLRGDAMTWWRSYCTTNGGLQNVFNSKTFSELLSELRQEFSDVDRVMQLRNKLFNIRQTQSVQQYVSLFRTTMVDLGPSQITQETAKHLFLYGLKPHIRREVFMHRPGTFQDMILLSERADQAYMADRNGVLMSGTKYKNSNYNGNNRGRYSNNTGRHNQQQQQQQHNYQNVSQFGNASYKGPAPMVLGTAQVCHYCGKPGHFQRDCFKKQNDQAGRGRGRGRYGGNGRGNGRGAPQRLNNVQEQIPTMDVNEVVRLGLAAVNNKAQQQVKFSEKVQANDGSVSSTKN